MNYLAILIAAVAAFAWGAAYYMTLSKQWLAAVGRTEPNKSPTPFIISFIALLIMAAVLKDVLGHFGPPSVKGGMIVGATLWLGFVATTVVVNNAYPGRKLSLSAIDGIHWLGVLVIQGAVLDAFGA